MALFRVLCWALIFILRNGLVLLLVLYVNWEEGTLQILTLILTQILTLILMVDVLPMVAF